VGAALRNDRLGLADNWLGHVRDLVAKHESRLLRCLDEDSRFRRLCELNVIEQVLNVSQTTIVQDAWRRNQELALHGWIYGIHDGLLRDLMITAEKPGEIEPLYKACIAGA